jgi:chemotaxis protein MotB
MEADDKRNTAKLLGIVIAVIAAIGWYLYFDQRQQQRAVSEDLTTTKANLEIEIQSLNQNLNDSKARNLELIAVNEALKVDVAASLAEKSALQQQMQQELERAIAANRELQRELETTAAAQRELQQELEATAAAQRELQQELESTAAARRELQQELESTVAARREQQRELERSASARQELQAELESRLTEQEMLNQQIVLAIGASGELEAQLQQEEDRRRQLQRQIDAVSGDIEMKEQALSDADKRFTELQQQLEQTRQVQAKLKLTVEELNRQRTEEAAHFAKLQDALKRELNESRVEISQLKNRSTVIKLTSEVLFDSGSAVIRPEGKRVLSLIAESLNAYPERAISIEGHTDNVPIGPNSKFVSNWELSAVRALAAVDFFQHKSQVDPGRLQMVGLGEFHPVAGNDSAEGRAQNRRIEIKLLPDN